MLIHDINNKKRQKHKALLCSWTHSWTVHSGIVFGIWPLFSRLQSTSSPEHAQGGGHVPAWAPHPRCILRESRKITANPANLRGCGEDHILFYFFSWPLTRERERERERTPLFGRIFGWSATNSTEWEVTKKHTKQSQICCLWPPQPLLISNPRLPWGPWRRNGTEKRSSRTRPFLWRKFCAVSAAAAAAVGATCALQDPHSTAWAHSRGMRGGGATGGAWVM